MLQTRIYIKPTDRSNHPRHLLNSLPKSQMLRVVRIDSDTTKREEDLTNMYKNFLERSYPEKLLLETKIWALSLKQNEVLKDSVKKDGDKNKIEKQDLYYVIQYGPNSMLVKDSVTKHWSIVNSDESLSKKLPKKTKFSYNRG